MVQEQKLRELRTVFEGGAASEENSAEEPASSAFK
jgi:hypothetical protein